MGVRSTQKIQVGSIVLVNFGHHNMRPRDALLLWLAPMLPHHHPLHRLGNDLLSSLVFPKDACLCLRLFHQAPDPHCFLLVLLCERVDELHHLTCRRPVLDDVGLVGLEHANNFLEVVLVDLDLALQAVD